MKKRIGAFLAALMMTASLAACGKQETGKTDEQSKVTQSDIVTETNKTPTEQVELTLWATSRNTDEFTAEREAAFEKANPGIKLNIVVKEGDPGNQFYSAVASGTAPDCILGSFTMMDKYISAGIVAPLNEYLEKWDETDKLDKAYLDMFKRNGKYYGIPNQVMPMLFAYNKALFKDAGIAAPPKTWDEAIEYAKKIDTEDGQIAGYATLTAEWTEWFFQYYVWQAGGDLTKENADGTAELTFTDPAVIEAAKYYQRLASEGVLPSDRTLKFGDLLDQFARGKIGMMPFAVDWVVDVANKGMDLDDLGLILPPAGPSGKSATAIAGECWVINANSSKAEQDAAWKYISFMTSYDERALFYENLASKGAIAPVTIPRTDMAITDFAELPLEWAPILSSVADIGRLEFYGKADFGSYVDRAVQKILTNPNADPKKEFAEVEAQARQEALDNFNAANKKK